MDVIVIGGGPAGSTVAALLARRGRQVLQLEKDHHPRFHIGESLLPMNLPILDELGVLDEVRRIGVVKHGAEFDITDAQGRVQTVAYKFAEAVEPLFPHAYQVRRSEFDHLLFRNSVRQGVDAREGVRVTEVTFAAPGRTQVQAVTDDGRRLAWTTRYLIDATGRDTFLSRKLAIKQRNPKHNSAAIFGHFDGVVRREGERAGNISICWFEHGWFWMIPLHDGSMSVGAVCWPEYLRTRDKDLPAFLWDTIALCPAVHERMGEATLIDGVARATGNFSYTAGRMSGPGYLLIGDAYAFIDPVFSSGVYLAMNSARLGAEVVDSCLRDPAQEAVLQRRFEKQVRRGLREFSWFIYRFTSPVMQKLFMGPKDTPFGLRSAVISLLAGDVFGRVPLRMPLMLFKTIYFSLSLANASRALPAYLRRRRNRTVGFTGGTTSQDPM